MREHENEPVRGLPEALPPGERILWQGAPDWRALTRRAMHVLKVAIYMAVLLAWNAMAAMGDGATAGEALVATLWLLPLPLVALGLLTAFGWGYAKTTVYTLTNRRLVIRSGVALPITVNLPYRVVASAAVKLHGGGLGDVPLRLLPGNRVSYLQLWPNVRPWHFTQPEPMLRCIPDAANVARILGAALADHHAADTGADPSAAALGPSHRLTEGRMRQSLVAAGH